MFGIFCIFKVKRNKMKRLIFSLVVCAVLIACNSSKNKNTVKDDSPIKHGDTVSISNSELEYEIIIIEPGFSTWLETRARPKGFYEQSFLESRNAHFVTAWNTRVLSPTQYDANLYEMQINFQQGVDYGYDVNYKLYNYFLYFQLKYKQQLTGFIPRN